MKTIFYWPDGIWCERYELSHMTHKSDDFTLIEVPNEFDYDQIEERVVALNRGDWR